MCMEVEDNLRESVLSFDHVCPGNQAQLFRLGSKCLYPMGHLASPKVISFMMATDFKFQQMKMKYVRLFYLTYMFIYLCT